MLVVWGACETAPNPVTGPAKSDLTGNLTPVASVTVTPSSAQILINKTVQLTATPKDAAGNPLEGRLVLWTTSEPLVALVDLNGLVTGLAKGSATITATSETKSGTSAITVTDSLPTGGDTVPGDTVPNDTTPQEPAPSSPPSTGLYPNEPAGFVPIAEHRFSCRPGEDQCQPRGIWTHEPGGIDNFSIQHDATAPQSPDSVGRTLFPTGQPSGSAPVWFDGWGDGGYASAFYRKLYVSLWVRIGGTDYENQAVGTKMGFIGYGEDPSGAANQGFAMLRGDGTQSVGSAFNLGFWQQNNVSRDMNQNVNTSKVMTVGPWHHWEWEMELNTLGESNGVFKWWVDGALITSYSDVVYITPGNTFGFYNYRWNPTWGGQGGTKTRNDYMDMDHIYISGVQ
jgi:hypothetical protein